MPDHYADLESRWGTGTMCCNPPHNHGPLGRRFDTQLDFHLTMA